ncbi:hypothetical protein P8452_67861 [Trifolium repens]|nr:hypothetical protein P8452_67861 [Trifolium repens]
MGSFEENDNDDFIEPASYGVDDLSPRIGPEYQAEISFVIKKSEQLRMNPADSESVHDKSHSLEIGLPISVIWSDADTKSFLLGLFIFGKNFVQIKRFLDNKGMGEILSFYYGKFYNSDGYRRWSECRKIKGRNCIIGQRLFTGLRQRKLLSRLISHVSKESQDNLLQVSKSYVEGTTSLEEYIYSLKSMVGIGVLVEAVGGYRLSKTKSTELFWEAVWPRLLARGWHSEKPKNRGYVTSEDYLVFLIPGVEKFSRRKLVKGVHYFDSVSDVLSKVVAEPSILELEEEEAKVGSFNEEKGSNEGDLSDDHRQCYLKPRSSPYKKDHTKFTVIDTSLVHGGKVSDLRGLKSVPINSVCKLEVLADGKRFKGKIYKRKVSRRKDMSKSIKPNSTKLTGIDTNRLSEGKLLNVKHRRYPAVEFEDASMMATSHLRESKGGFSTDDLPRMVEAKLLRCGKKKVNETDSCRYDIPDNDANKMVEIQKSQQATALDDYRLKRIIKNQFNRRVRSGNSNHIAVPIKRRRLTACAKAEERRIVENSSGDKGSDKLGFSLSSSFPDSNKNVCDPISHQQNGSSTSFETERIVEENSDNYQYTGVSCKALFSEYERTKVCRLMNWLIKDEDSEYYQKLREFEYKKTARNKLNKVVLQKHQKSLEKEVNRETDEAVIKMKQTEEIRVKQAEAAKVKEMQETEALASSGGNQLASTSSAPNDDEVVILTKEKYERLLQSAEKVDKLEEKLLQILNLLQQRNIVISDELTTQKVQLLNM